MATADEIEHDEEIRALTQRAQKDRWLAFRVVSANGATENALPAGASININFPIGTPSAEGPLKTTKPQHYAFKTFGPLRVTKHECAYNRRCSPTDAWTVEFSNPLDAAAFQQSQVRVAPKVTDLRPRFPGVR